jgi:tetratricopeptide (TPR) repeat protein
MTSKSKINIVSNLPIEFCNTVRVNDSTYLVQTEDTGTKTCNIMTRVYSKGEVVSSRKADYSHLVTLKDFKNRLKTLMENQHKHTIELFLLEQSGKEKSKSDYAEEVKQLLRKGNGKSAFNILRHAIERFPDDPFLLSYYGCLIAVVDNNPKEGIRICREAIEKLKGSSPFGAEFFFPVFYLNLGRAYLKDSRKNEAISAFLEGLENEPQNRDLLWEMKRLGTRKRPALPFLSRGNPLNKYIGMLLYRDSTIKAITL